jgi:hypothetical protein
VSDRYTIRRSVARVSASVPPPGRQHLTHTSPSSAYAACLSGTRLFQRTFWNLQRLRAPCRLFARSIHQPRQIDGIASGVPDHDGREEA